MYLVENLGGLEQYWVNGIGRGSWGQRYDQSCSVVRFGGYLLFTILQIYRKGMEVYCNEYQLKATGQKA